ncbi:MAG: hypothetical protein HW421_3617 [Ignavibacteria bacterium]|nr:hypothetical protein [Ignavibacteria bacterium]
MSKYFFSSYIQLIMAILLSSTIAKAQQTETFTKEEQKQIEYLKTKQLNGSFGIAFINSVPQGAYQENIKSSGQGFYISGGYMPFEKIPVIFGLDFNMIFFKSDEKLFQYGTKPQITEDTVSASSWIIPIHLFTRVQMDLDFILPYAEVFGGLSIINSDWTYKSSTYKEDNESDIHVPFSYGFCVGSLFQLANIITLPASRVRIDLDVKGKYVFGNESEYSTVTIQSDQTAKFDKHNSKTDMFILLVGVTFRF